MLYTDATVPWIRALTRANAHLIRVERIDDRSNDDVQTWHSTSKSDSAILGQYRQTLDANGHGIWLTCSCEATTPCLHLAKVLEVEGHIPALPAGYTGGALRSSWGKPAGPVVDGKTALALLSGE